MSGSCVTRTIVRPARLSPCRSASTSTLVRVSRLPVGSSARITAGSLTRALAIATLLLPARELARVVAGAVGQTDRGEPLARARAPLARGEGGVEQRQLDVLERRRSRQQVE